MASLSAQSAQDVIAALRLQQEWGVDALVEDMPWDVWKDIPVLPQRLREEGQKGRAGTGPVGRMRQEGGPAGQWPSTRGAPRIPAKATSRTPEEARAALEQAGDVPALVRASRDLPGITLQKTASHHLAPILVKEAPFLLIGDVPNEDEDRYGTLFAGPMGKLLERMLASIGLEREQLAMAPAIPWRPPGGQRVSQRELEACLPILHRTINLAQPRRIVTLGATPAWMLLQKDARLNQLRGRWHEVEVPGMEVGLPVLPLWHPLQLGENAGRRKALWADLLNLARTLGEDSAGG